MGCCKTPVRKPNHVGLPSLFPSSQIRMRQGTMRSDEEGERERQRKRWERFQHMKQRGKGQTRTTKPKRKGKREERRSNTQKLSAHIHRHHRTRKHKENEKGETSRRYSGTTKLKQAGVISCVLVFEHKKGKKECTVQRVVPFDGGRALFHVPLPSSLTLPPLSPSYSYAGRPVQQSPNLGVEVPGTPPTQVLRRRRERRGKKKPTHEHKSVVERPKMKVKGKTQKRKVRR